MLKSGKRGGGDENMNNNEVGWKEIAHTDRAITVSVPSTSTDHATNENAIGRY